MRPQCLPARPQQSLALPLNKLRKITRDLRKYGLNTANRLQIELLQIMKSYRSGGGIANDVMRSEKNDMIILCHAE